MYKFRLFTFVLLASASPKAVRLAAASETGEESGKWISLYSGREASFSNADRARVITVLNDLGVEHREDRDQQILIREHTRDRTQDLVAGLITQVKPGAKTPRNLEESAEGNLKGNLR